MEDIKQINEVKNSLSPIVISLLGERYVVGLIDERYGQIKKATLGFNVINKLENKKLEDRIRKMKVRWADLGTNEEFIEEEIKDRLSELKIEFNTDDKGEIKKGIKSEIENWKNEKSSYLHRYRYIEHKQNRQIIAAIKNDIDNMIFEQGLCIDEGIANIIKLPDALAVPVDYTNRGRIDIEENLSQLEISDSNYVVDTYRVSDNTVFQSLVGMSDYKQGAVSSVIRKLNGNDVSILTTLLKMSDESLFIDREVVSSITGLLKELDRPNNGRNYSMIKDSLYKIQFMKLRVIDEKSRGFTVQILDNVRVYKEKGTEYISVVFNVDIIEQIIGKQVTSMYTNVINKYKLPMSRGLIYQLQKMREEISVFNNKKLTNKVHYTVFRERVNFKDNRKLNNLRDIEFSLNEIAMSNTTLKSFQRVGEFFNLEFYPITAKEKKDFVLD